MQVERNLEGDLSHSVPDFCIDGTLSSVHASIDVNQYKLIKGLLEHNFGEELEEFQRPMMAHLQDPKIQVNVLHCTHMLMSNTIPTVVANTHIYFYLYVYNGVYRLF